MLTNEELIKNENEVQEFLRRLTDDLAASEPTWDGYIAIRHDIAKHLPTLCEEHLDLARQVQTLSDRVLELEAELEKKTYALKVAEKESNRHFKGDEFTEVNDILRNIYMHSSAALDSHPPFRHSQEA